MKKFSILLFLLFVGSTFLLETLQEASYPVIHKIKNEQEIINSNDDNRFSQLCSYRFNAELIPEQKKNSS